VAVLLLSMAEQLTTAAKASQTVLFALDLQESGGRVQLRDTARQSNEQLELLTEHDDPSNEQFNGTTTTTAVALLKESAMQLARTTLLLLQLVVE
jgi:hypothetical protein